MANVRRAAGDSVVMVSSVEWRQIQDEVNTAGLCPRRRLSVDAEQSGSSAADASIVMVPSEAWREIQDELRPPRETA